MSGTVNVFHRIPKELEKEVRTAIYKILFEKGQKDGKVYQTIRDNPTMTLTELRYQLKKQGIRRSLEGIKKIADWCELPYKEE